MERAKPALLSEYGFRRAELFALKVTKKINYYGLLDAKHFVIANERLVDDFQWVAAILSRPIQNDEALRQDQLQEQSEFQISDLPGQASGATMKIIEDLLRIKTHREQQAESHLSQASRQLQAATEAVKKAQIDLDQAHAAHDARKAALYADLFSRLVQKNDIDIAHAELEKMHVVIKESEIALQSARQQEHEAKENREQMRIMYRNAFRAREKYTELSQQARIEKARVELHKEDMELEELLPKRAEDDTANPGGNRESVA